MSLPVRLANLVKWSGISELFVQSHDGEIWLKAVKCRRRRWL